MGIERRGPEKTQAVWLEKFVLGGAGAAGPRPKNQGKSWNHQWEADDIGYALGDPAARQRIIERYKKETADGHCWNEQTNASHGQWYLIAHGTIRWIALERGDSEVLALNSQWWLDELTLGAIFWWPQQRNEEVVYPGSRAWATSAGGGGRGLPGGNPYLSDVVGAVAFGQRLRLRDGYPKPHKNFTPTEPDSFALRIVDRLLNSGDDLAWEPGAGTPKLRVPIGIAKLKDGGRLLFLTRQDVRAWDELVPPITYWIRLRGDEVEYGFEPLAELPEPDEVIGA